MNNKIPLFLTGFLYFVVIIGCSTKQNTPGSRAYHELTTRYNIYFNAEEAYHEILENRVTNYREDYAELLPFYPSIAAIKEQSAGGPFDPVIEKTGKAIGEHSITAKPRRDPTKAQSQEYRQWLRQEEFNPFLKNVWLLRGKAFLQNGNYDEALSIFSGMLRLYSHDRALIDETEIWMLRAYTEMGRSYEAAKIVYAFKDKQLPKRLENLFAEHYTLFLIRENRCKEAIPYLQKTIAQEKYTPQKQRLQFLLGQLFVVTGEKNKAYQAFEKVKGLHTPFEIALHATVWQAAIATGEPQHDMMRQLKKMEQKVNDADSAAFADRRYRIYMKVGNDSLAQAYRPLLPDRAASVEVTAIAANDTNSMHNPQVTAISTVEHPPQRLSQGRTLAENAALHRQWRLRNGLWQSQQYSSMGTADSEKAMATPFSADKNGLHSLLLAFASDGENAADKNRLLFATADFNFSHFKLRKFNTSYIHLPGAEALQIEPFRSFDEASRYMERMKSDSLVGPALATGISPVIISEENLRRILSGKTLQDYHLFYAENLAPARPTLLPASEAWKAENKAKEGQEPEKIVSLEISPVAPEKAEQTQPYERETPEALKRRLEENAAKALQQQQETAPAKNRKQLLKERQRQREEKIRQRERDLKERQRKREAALKQREKERTKKIERQR